ncbi:MAG: hypothetical protein HKN73_06635 [Gemmatimonadetes bacterium]|nr:hypothetical protein [Gemmatimonadota bacterium]
MSMTGTKKRRGTVLRDAVDSGADKAREGLDSAKDRAVEFVDDRADDVGVALHRVSTALREASESVEQAGSRLGARGDAAAGRVEQASRYLRKGDYDDFRGDLTDLARRHVGWSVALAFAAGVAVARLGRS